jgi:hypothetical protein
MKLILWCVAIFATTQAMGQDHGELVYNVRLNIPGGKSVWTADFHDPIRVNPLKILYVSESSCGTGPYITISVRSERTGRWQQTNYQDGLDYHEVRGPIDGIKFDLDSPYWRTITCTINVYGRAESSGGWDNPEFAGLFSYRGGYVHQQKIDLSEAAMIKGFRLAVPLFCGEMEVLSAGTISEGIFDEAELAVDSERVFEVNSGEGLRVRSLEFSVNGPTDLQCDVPIYIYRK